MNIEFESEAWSCLMYGVVELFTHFFCAERGLCMTSRLISRAPALSSYVKSHYANDSSFRDFRAQHPLHRHRGFITQCDMICAKLNIETAAHLEPA